MHPARRGLRPGSRMRSSAIRNHGAVRRKHRTPRRPDALVPFPASIRDKACNGQRPEYAPYRASDSVPERTDRARRHPIPRRDIPIEKTERAATKICRRSFGFDFSPGGIPASISGKKGRNFVTAFACGHCRSVRRDRLLRSFSPLSSFRSMRFRTTRLPISTLFPENPGKHSRPCPTAASRPHDDNRKTGHLVSSHDDPADRTPRIAARREARPTGSHRTTGRNEESILPKALTNHPAMQGDHTGGNASGRTSTARPPAAGRSERTVRNIIKIIEKRMERKRSTAGLTCGKHGPSPDGCPSP